MEIQLDAVLRQQAKKVFDRLGLSEEEAIQLFYQRVAACGCMPFGESIKETKPKKKKRMNERFAEWDAF